MGWETDYNYDEFFTEGEGIVSILKCCECGAEAIFSLQDEDEINKD